MERPQLKAELQVCKLQFQIASEPPQMSSTIYNSDAAMQQDGHNDTYFGLSLSIAIAFRFQPRVQNYCNN